MVAADARPGLRLLVTVTFNENQLRSHLLPLIELDEVESITLVSDVEPPPLPKVTAVVPSARAKRTLGRAGAKLSLLRRLGGKERYDWVIGFNFVPHGFNAQLVAERLGTRSLYHMIGGELEWLGGGYAGGNAILSRLPRPVPPLERFLLRRIARCDVVGVMGPHGRQQLISHGVSPSRVVELPPSVDVPRFRGRPQQEPRWDIVTVGRLAPVKRQRELLDVIAVLTSSHPHVRAALAGDGPLELELASYSRTLGIGDRVDFLGRVSEVEAVYSDARVFVLTSASEGMPIALAEAMCSGLPVVASAVGEIPSLIEHERNGLLYEPGDAATLAKLLDRLLSDPKEAARLAQAGSKTVRERLSVEAGATRYRALMSDRFSEASWSSSSSTIAQ